MDINELLTKDKKTLTAVKTEKKNKKMGRPKKAVKTDNKLCCYLTDEENEKFEVLANEEALSKSAFTRKIILKYLKESI